MKKRNIVLAMCAALTLAMGVGAYAEEVKTVSAGTLKVSTSPEFAP